MKTKQLYYEDAYLDSANATVLSSNYKNGTSELILDQTIFYPGGGGQPYDLGTINGFEVEKVFMSDGEIVHKVYGELKVGEKVELILNFERRLKYMKIHSAGHLIHDVLVSKNMDITPIKGDHGDNAYLQYQGMLDISPKELEKLVRDKVKDGLEIVTKDVTFEELEKEVGVLQPGVPKNKRLRLLKIGKFKGMADGGVQVKNTKEIGEIKIDNIQNKDNIVTVNYGLSNVAIEQIQNIKFYISNKVKERFPDLDEVVMSVYGVNVHSDESIISTSDFDKSINGMSDEEFYSQKDFVDFRNFCKDLNIDLKKYPPSVEFLFSRYQKSAKVPHINSVVDCANKVAVETYVATGVFDLSKIKGDLVLRFSKTGEIFMPLGGDTESLPEGLVVIADDEKVLNLFPFRDSIYQKITEDTKDILILADKMPGGELDKVNNAVQRVGELVEKYCGGKKGEPIGSEIKEEKGLSISIEDLSKMENTRRKRRVFSGTRATGRLHLGNYLGAVKGFLELQERSELDCVFMAVDVHTITTPYDNKTLKDSTREIILDYLACGLDPEKVIVTVQSLIPEHTELAFLFSSIMSVARMQHLPTFKDKIKQHPDNVTMALLNYPILMAADILIYNASLVPVGIDQEPHLEIAREIARKMNETYGTKFPEPVRFATKGEYVPSLAGEGKMSKSVEGSYINLTDDLKTIQKRLAGAPTDSGKGDEIPKTGGVANILKFVELFQGIEKRKIYEKMYLNEGIRYGDLKKELADSIYRELKPIQMKREELLHKTSYVDEVIKSGAEKARKIAAETVLEVKEKMGLL